MVDEKCCAACGEETDSELVLPRGELHSGEPICEECSTAHAAYFARKKIKATGGSTITGFEWGTRQENY